jgi:hypothetical protein
MKGKEEPEENPFVVLVVAGSAVVAAVTAGVGIESTASASSEA